MLEKNFKQDYPWNFMLREQDQGDKEYLWHEHFYCVVGNKRVCMTRNTRKRKNPILEIWIEGWIDSKTKEETLTDCDTTHEWKKVREYSIDDHLIAVREYMDVLRELLTSADLLKDELFGMSYINRNFITADEDLNKKPNEEKWGQPELFEEWKGIKKPKLEKYLE